MPRAITGIVVIIILICFILLSGCSKEEAPAATDLANATPIRGHVLKDGISVAGAYLEAVSIDGSQRISNLTDKNGDYILGLQPRVWYRITARSGSLKHSVLPAYVPETGNRTDEYDINLTGTSTIEGGPTPDSPWKGKGVYVVAAPADGGEPTMTVTGDDGRFTLTVKPGVYYTLTGVSYDQFGTPFSADMYYLNTIGCTKVKPGADETIRLEYFAKRPALSPATPVALIVNGTVGVIDTKVEPPARAPTSPVPSGGRVYLDNKTVRGARVEAVSVDGADHVTALTNGTGAYVLNLEPGVLYRATATYNGLKHRIWPVSQEQFPADGHNDIYLSSTHRSTIAVLYDNNHAYNSTPALLEAVPADGSVPVVALTNGSGWYYLNVIPGVKYNLQGRCYDPFGQNGYFNFNYPQDSPDRIIVLGQDETMVATSGVFFVHAPKSVFWWRDPTTGSVDLFKPPVPVTVTGRVFIDDRPANGANVTAIMPGLTDGAVSTIADDNGTYILNITSRRQYEITATGGGRKHTVQPVHVQDDKIGVYNIRLTQRPTSTISGIIDPDQEWPVQQGNVITAVPAGGGMPVTATSGADGSFSLDVKPLTYYDISGKSVDTDGKYHNLRFYYYTGVSCTGFMLRPDETVMIGYTVL